MVFLENRQISLQNTCRSGQYESAIYIFSNKINTCQLHISIILLYLWNTLRIIAQSALTIRLDSDLKMQFDSLCEEFGMSTNTAFNIYVRQWSDL